LLLPESDSPDVVSSSVVDESVSLWVIHASSCPDSFFDFSTSLISFAICSSLSPRVCFVRLLSLSSLSSLPESDSSDVSCRHRLQTSRNRFGPSMLVLVPGLSDSQHPRSFHSRCHCPRALQARRDGRPHLSQPSAVHFEHLDGMHAFMACSTYVVVGLTCRAGMPSPRRNLSKVSGRCPTCAVILFQSVMSLNGACWLM
jgi:hypothetical protein